MLEFFKRNNLKFSLALSFFSLIIIVLSQTSDLKLGSKIIPGLIQTIAYPFQFSAEYISETVSGIWNGYVNMIDLKQVNKELLAENIRLRAENQNLIEKAQENIRLRKFLDIPESEQQKQLLAQAVYLQESRYSDVLVLNKGKKDGVAKNQAVISSNGAVGKIFKVSNSLSQVQLLPDTRSKVPALLSGSRVRGLLQGSQDGTLYLKFIPSDLEVEIGNSVITSGLAGIFQKGVILGKVKTVSKNEHDLFQVITVEPAVNFNRLEELSVVLYSRLNEYNSLFTDG